MSQFGNIKKGALHKELHKKANAPLSIDELRRDLAKAKRDGNVKEERRIVFAINAHHFHHGDKHKS